MRSMSQGPTDSETAVRSRQTIVLQALAARLGRGDQLLPADVMARMTDELERRVDREAVTRAWEEQGQREPTAWRGETARMSRRSRGRDVRHLSILDHAQNDLVKLDSLTREEVNVEIDALAFDPLPRGADALHGFKDDHVALHVGDWRLIYRVHPDSVVVVAITGYE